MEGKTPTPRTKSQERSKLLLKSNGAMTQEKNKKKKDVLSDRRNLVKKGVRGKSRKRRRKDDVNLGRGFHKEGTTPA